MKWEYKIVRTDERIGANKLRQLGYEGWEMCGVYVLDELKVVEYYFKRQIA